MTSKVASLPTGHAFMPMQNEFFGWLDRAKYQGHLTTGNVTRAKQAFINRFQVATQSAGSTANQNLKDWIEKIKLEGHITNGNAKYMSNAVSNAYNRTLNPVNQPKNLEDVLKKAGVNDTHKLHQFFFDKNFKYLDKYYDLRIEDCIGVLWLDPSTSKNDALFLQELNKNYPKEMKVLCTRKKFGGNGAPYIDLQNSTRFANNDIYSALQEFKNDPKVLTVIKKILKHGIINYS